MSRVAREHEPPPDKASLLGMSSNWIHTKERQLFTRPWRILSKFLQLTIYVFRHANKLLPKKTRELSMLDSDDYGQAITIEREWHACCTRGSSFSRSFCVRLVLCCLGVCFQACCGWVTSLESRWAGWRMWMSRGREWCCLCPLLTDRPATCPSMSAAIACLSTTCSDAKCSSGFAAHPNGGSEWVFCSLFAPVRRRRRREQHAADKDNCQ